MIRERWHPYQSPVSIQASSVTYFGMYVYEGTVVEDILKANAKDIINAADKYGVVSLKLEAEAAYVESTKITVDNAMDNLLYADAKNCALLKEAVIDFLTDNGREVISKVSFADFPGHIVKDLLIATARKTRINLSMALISCVSVS